MGEVSIVTDARRRKAVVSGTSVTVEEILLELAGGRSAEEVVARHRGLTLGGIAAALRYAALHVDREFRYAPPPPDTGPHSARESAAAYAPWASEPQVSLDAEEYDELLYRLDFLQDISEGLVDAAAGRTVPHEKVFERLLAKYPA